MRCLLVALALGLLLGLAQPCSAVEFYNGTPDEQALVVSTLAASSFDWSLLERRFGEITVIFREGAGGMAARGRVWLGSEGILAYSIPHEFSHQIWFAMNPFWRLKWEWFCTFGVTRYDARKWIESPAENFAECMRVALFPASEWAPQTALRLIAPDRCHAFLGRWKWTVRGVR